MLPKLWWGVAVEVRAQACQQVCSASFITVRGKGGKCTMEEGTNGRVVENLSIEPQLKGLRVGRGIDRACGPTGVASGAKMTGVPSSPH